MKTIDRNLIKEDEFPNGEPVNISRRGFLLSAVGAATGALVLGFGLPVRPAMAQSPVAAVVPGTRVPAFIEIRPDNTVRLMSPFMEGGQGIFTALAQIVGEELDMDPHSFIVENAPAGADYLLIFGKMRFTGGSMSVRMSYDTMRNLGASARAMILQAAAGRLGVPVGELTTEPRHPRGIGKKPALWRAGGRSYGAPRSPARNIDVKGQVAVPLDRQARATAGRF